MTLDVVNRTFGWRVGCLAIAGTIAVVGVIALVLVPGRNGDPRRARENVRPARTTAPSGAAGSSGFC